MLTWHPSRTLDSPRALLPELQRYKDTVRCVALGAEVPGQRTTNANLVHAFVENKLVFVAPKIVWLEPLWFPLLETSLR